MEEGHETDMDGRKGDQRKETIKWDMERKGGGKARTNGGRVGEGWC